VKWVHGCIGLGELTVLAYVQLLDRHINAFLGLKDADPLRIGGGTEIVEFHGLSLSNVMRVAEQS
jgi:hypothetical protein